MPLNSENRPLVDTSLTFVTHAAPTLADITLPPRRRLRDGSNSSRSSRSSRGSSLPRGIKRLRRSESTRSEQSDTAQLESSVPSAEESRRLPRLKPRSRSEESIAPEDLSDKGDPSYIDMSSAKEEPINGAREVEESGHPSPSGSGGERRRYTAQEKGKGRAREPSHSIELFELDSDSEMSHVHAPHEEAEESIQWIGAKPSSLVLQDETTVNASADPLVVIDEASAISAFTCPVCFCAPNAPVITPCGHVLCYGCLHSSLIASIGRLPNPYPNRIPLFGRRGRGGAGRGGGRGRNRPMVSTTVQPSAWDLESLREAWSSDLDRKLRLKLQGQGIDRMDADAMVELDQGDRHIDVQQLLQGLWKIDGKYVIEGECPVCRESISGGLGPIGSSVGGVILLETAMRRRGE